MGHGPFHPFQTPLTAKSGTGGQVGRPKAIDVGGANGYSGARTLTRRRAGHVPPFLTVTPSVTDGFGGRQRIGRSAEGCSIYFAAALK